MSHFSTIKTKLKSSVHLIEALEDLGHDVQEQKQMMVVADKEHAKGHPNVEVHITAGTDIGFRWSETTSTYELVTDLQTWDQSVPVERFLQKLSQQYALKSIQSSVKEEGFEIAEQKQTDDGSIELVCTRWD